MDLKQSLTNIKTWAKEHPYAALAILGGVILLGWYVSKQARSGALTIAEPGAAESGSSLDTLGANLGGGGFADILGDLNTSASPLPTPSPVASIPSMTGASMDAGLGAFPSFTDTFGALPSVSNPSLVSAGGILPMTGEVSARNMGLDTHRRSKSQPGKGIGERVAKNNPLKRKDEDQTPAMRVGKGRHFTGSYLGVYYVNGYPVTSGPIVGTSVLPGGRVASNVILGLSGGSSAPSGTTGGGNKGR